MSSTIHEKVAKCAVLLLVCGRDDIASWEGGWKRLAMSNLLGVQVESFQNVLAWQTGFEEKTAGRPPNPGRLELAEANQTDLQKTQAR